jgi:hypothetical protein
MNFDLFVACGHFVLFIQFEILLMTIVGAKSGSTDEPQEEKTMLIMLMRYRSAQSRNEKTGVEVQRDNANQRV